LPEEAGDRLLSAHACVGGYRVICSVGRDRRVLRREVTSTRTDILRIDVFQVVRASRTAKIRRISSAIVVVVPGDLGTASTVPAALSAVNDVLLDVDRRAPRASRVDELLEAGVRSGIRRVVEVVRLKRAGAGSAASSRIAVEGLGRQVADVADVADVLGGRRAAAGNATEAVVFRVEGRNRAGASGAVNRVVADRDVAALYVDAVVVAPRSGCAHYVSAHYRVANIVVNLHAVVAAAMINGVVQKLHASGLLRVQLIEVAARIGGRGRSACGASLGAGIVDVRVLHHDANPVRTGTAVRLEGDSLLICVPALDAIHGNPLEGAGNGVDAVVAAIRGGRLAAVDHRQGAAPIAANRDR